MCGFCSGKDRYDHYKMVRDKNGNAVIELSFGGEIAVNYCPMCGVKLTPETSVVVAQEDIDQMFELLWRLYPRKDGKQQAKKTFEHKLRKLPREKAKSVANNIYLLVMRKRNEWSDNDTPLQFIPMFSSLLNAEVPDSPKFKGSKTV